MDAGDLTEARPVSPLSLWTGRRLAGSEEGNPWARLGRI
jgi:hypothetical protein